jgi:ABC-type polysaccharide/polyol phosphate transport system ATPase subunit
MMAVDGTNILSNLGTTDRNHYIQNRTGKPKFVAIKLRNMITSTFIFRILFNLKKGAKYGLLGGNDSGKSSR